MRCEKQITQSYEIARERYAALGVDTENVMKVLAEIPISMHCWQGDDVNGFEITEGGATGGIMSTGNYPGRAGNAAELRADLDFALSLLPGTMRVNIHAMYLESEKAVNRDAIAPEHFANWIQWAKEKKIGLDFNPTCFGHSMMVDGMTLSSPKEEVRKFWIEHCKRSREISEAMGRALGKRCVMNIWVPDGFKDIPVDRMAARRRLKDSLDQVLADRKDPALMADAVESKLFGLGCESCTIGSHEFYMAYAMDKKIMLTLDSGHFHPTEVISDKISSSLLFMDEILLHVSRPVRWDSDHVVIFDDELQAIASEIVRCGVNRVNIGLDYFDGTVNRIIAWCAGTRNMQKALCTALLAPSGTLSEYEYTGDFSSRLALTEELKAMPWSDVYDYYCLKHNVPVGTDYIGSAIDYVKKIAAARGV